jgi:hypothetical protein
MLPDLAITGVATSTEYQDAMEDSPYDGVTWMVFHVHVRNVGGAPLDVSLMVTYAVGETDIASSSFPFSGDVGSGDLAIGDSTTVTAKGSAAWFHPGVRVRFFLRVDDDPPSFYHPKDLFGNHPTAELSIENNFFDFVVN